MFDRRKFLLGVVAAPFLPALASAAERGLVPTPSPEALKGAEWSIAEIDGEGLVAGSRISLVFGEGRRMFGHACNVFRGTYLAGPGTLSVEQGLSTSMACSPELMRQEQAFFGMLPQLNRFRVASDGGGLLLATADGRRLTARRMV
jgi:putative lipoprotein